LNLLADNIIDDDVYNPPPVFVCLSVVEI
jgi:hypothetical protein